MESNASQQVWQRVLTPQQPKRQDLRPLILSAQESAALFRQLAAAFTGSLQEQARNLYRSQADTLSCLIGLELLSGNPKPAPKPMPIPKEPAGNQLRKAFSRSKAAVTEYTARSLDPEFGVVFHCLAQQEEQRATAIATLLGSLGGSKEKAKA